MSEIEQTENEAECSDTKLATYAAGQAGPITKQHSKCSSMTV